MKQRVIWYVMSALAAVAATILARASLGRLWRVTGHEPSESPFEASLPEALTWAAAAGAAVGVARVLAKRATAAGFERVTGESPEAVVGS
jgi:uncharacterized protein (DUF2236 family)